MIKNGRLHHSQHVIMFSTIILRQFCKKTDIVSGASSTWEISTLDGFLENKKVAFGNYTFNSRLSCYSVISSLQIFDDISYIIRKSPSAIVYPAVDFLVIPLYRLCRFWRYFLHNKKRDRMSFKDFFKSQNGNDVIFIKI